jgi:predicted nucleic acid-binding protein
MNLVDSCGWLEVFAEGPNAGFFAPALEDREELLVPTICLFEVFKRVLDQRGEKAALEAAAFMQRGRLEELSSAIALSAARLLVEKRLPLADSIILATARRHSALVWTQDAHFEGLEGVRYVARKTG